jgi:tRNA uridine 5-carboxymethylaminomethyl modification enzyme
MAGLNAALAAGGSASFQLDRADGYLGVLVDDLVTLGVTEPYRMFTSRAEYRLWLRADNADQRLTGRGIAIGCVGSERQEAFAVKSAALLSARALAGGLKASPSVLAKRGVSINRDGVARSALDLLAYPDVDWTRVVALWPELADIGADIAEQLTIDALYEGYLSRQRADIAAFRRDEALELPAAIDYAAIGSLSTEVKQKLLAHRPTNLGQAARISGVTPAALVALLKHVRRRAA